MPKKEIQRAPSRVYAKLHDTMEQVIKCLKRCKRSPHVVASIRHKMKRCLRSKSTTHHKILLWNTVTRHCLIVLNRIVLTRQHHELRCAWVLLQSHLHIHESFTHRDVESIYNEWANEF